MDAHLSLPVVQEICMAMCILFLTKDSMGLNGNVMNDRWDQIGLWIRFDKIFGYISVFNFLHN